MTASSEPPELTAGDAGEWVAELQRLLQAGAYFYDPVSGIFDDATLAALAQFQQASGLPVVDHVDATLWNHLRETEAAGQPAGGTGEWQGETDEWHWDGTQWVSAQEAAVGEVAGHGDPGSGSTGHVDAGPDAGSDESNWHWDGYQWQPTDTRGQDA